MLTPSRKADLKERFKEPASCNMWQCPCRSHITKKTKPRQTFKHDNKVLQKTLNKVEERERKFYALMWKLYLIPFGCDDDET